MFILRTVAAPNSLFQWFLQPTYHERDSVGAAITGNIWRNPQALAKVKLALMGDVYCKITSIPHSFSASNYVAFKDIFQILSGCIFQLEPLHSAIKDLLVPG